MSVYRGVMPLLSLGEITERTGIPRRTLNWAINTGQLDATKLGAGAWMVDPDDLDEWMKATGRVGVAS